MRGRFRRSLGGALAAMRNFLRGFIGLAGAGGAASEAPPQEGGAATPAGARDALAERAARRKSCC